VPDKESERRDGAELHPKTRRTAAAALNDCATYLRIATEPLTVHEIADRIALRKGLDQRDKASMDKMAQCANRAMEEVFSRRQVVRIAGNPRRRKGGRWELAVLSRDPDLPGSHCS
jgi:hypothetical protein